MSQAPPKLVTLTQDIREGQETGDDKLYISWEAYVKWLDVPSSGVERVKVFVSELQQYGLAHTAVDDPAKSMCASRIIQPVGIYFKNEETVVFSPYWQGSLPIATMLPTDKGHLKNELDVLRWLVHTTSTLAIMHQHYCTLDGAWELMITDDQAQLRAERAFLAAAQDIALSPAKLIALTTYPDMNAWICPKWDVLLLQQEDEPVLFADGIKAVDRLVCGEFRLPELKKNRTKLHGEWKRFVDGCFRDIKQVIGILLMFLKRRRISSTELAWILRDDGEHVGDTLKPLLKECPSVLAVVVAVVFEYGAQYSAWMKEVCTWDKKRKAVDMWHWKSFPVVVEQLKAAYWHKAMTRLGRWNAGARSLAQEAAYIKAAHERKLRMDKLALLGRRKAQHRVRARAFRVHLKVSAEEELRRRRVDKIMRRLIKKWADEDVAVHRYARFTNWSVAELLQWSVESIMHFIHEERKLTLRLEKGTEKANPYRVDRARSLLVVFAELDLGVVKDILSKSTGEEASITVEEDEQSLTSLENSLPDIPEHGLKDAWIRLLTIPASFVQGFVQLIRIHLERLLRRFRGLPELLIASMSSAEDQMQRRMVTSLLVGERKEYLQAHYAAQGLIHLPFFYNLGESVTRALKITRHRWSKACRMVVAEALYDACRRNEPLRQRGLHLCASRLQALARGHAARELVSRIWRTADEMLRAIGKQSVEAGGTEELEGTMGPEHKGVTPTRLIHFGWQPGMIINKKRRIDIRLCLWTSGLSDDELAAVRRRLLAHRLVAESIQRTDAGQRVLQAVIRIARTTTAERHDDCEPLQVPDSIHVDHPMQTAAHDHAIVGWFCLAFRDLQPGVSYTIELQLDSEGNVCLKDAFIQGTAGDSIHDKPFEALIVSTRAEAAIHSPMLEIAVGFEPSVGKPDGSVNSSVVCKVSWPATHIPSESVIYKLQRAEYSIDHDIVSMIWVTIHEGAQLQFHDILPEGLVDRTRTRSVWLAYRVCASNEYGEGQFCLPESVDLTSEIARLEQTLAVAVPSMIAQTASTNPAATEIGGFVDPLMVSNLAPISMPSNREQGQEQGQEQQQGQGQEEDTVDSVQAAKHDDAEALSIALRNRPSTEPDIVTMLQNLADASPLLELAGLPSAGSSTKAKQAMKGSNARTTKPATTMMPVQRQPIAKSKR